MRSPLLAYKRTQLSKVRKYHGGASVDAASG